MKKIKIAAAMRGRGHPYVQFLEIRGGQTNAITSVMKDNLIIEFYEDTEIGKVGEGED